jgi:hypothetical protein
LHFAFLLSTGKRKAERGMEGLKGRERERNQERERTREGGKEG